MSTVRDAHCDGVLGAVVGDLRLGAWFVLLTVASWMAVTLLVSWWRRCVRFRRLELNIAGPKSLPFIGNTLSLVGINKDTALDITLEMWGGHYGELSRVSFFNNLIVFVTDAKHVQQVVSDRRLQDKPDFYYMNLATLTGQGLVTANGELWKAHRTAIVPTLNAKVLEGFLDIFSAEAKNFVERMRPALGRDVRYTEDLSFTAAMAVIQTAVSVTEDDKAFIEVLAGSHLSRALEIIGTRTLRPWLWLPIIFDRTQLGRDMARIKRFIYDHLHVFIQRRAGEIRAATEAKQEGRRVRILLRIAAVNI